MAVAVIDTVIVIVIDTVAVHSGRGTARCRGLTGGSVADPFRDYVGVSVVALVRFRPPPFTPDMGISSIRRCQLTR